MKNTVSNTKTANKDEAIAADEFVRLDAGTLRDVLIEKEKEINTKNQVIEKKSSVIEE